MEPTTLLPIGLGLIVIGAAMGIGKFATAAAESIARQPEAADKITGAINLPLFFIYTKNCTPIGSLVNILKVNQRAIFV